MKASNQDEISSEDNCEKSTLINLPFTHTVQVKLSNISSKGSLFILVYLKYSKGWVLLSSTLKSSVASSS